jgi:hypothetical protein
MDPTSLHATAGDIAVFLALVLPLPVGLVVGLMKLRRECKREAARLRHERLRHAHLDHRKDRALMLITGRRAV